MHATIATAADLSLLQTAVSRPVERIADYEKLLPPYMTPLCAKIHKQYGDMESMSRLIRFATEATSELGEWCADQVWFFGLADEEANKLEGKIERSFNAEKVERPVHLLDQELNRIRNAKEIVKTHVFPPPVFVGNSLSSKVKRLLEYLNGIFERPTDSRCIVFTRQRYTARLLGELFSRIGSPHLRIGVLIGTRASEAGDAKLTVRHQFITIMKFRKGELNCLFATSVAEEGLDIPDCNTVIRFDLYDTIIQYIQSRGRARHKNSRYLHMIERENRAHLEILKHVRSGEQVLKTFCEALPADRLLQGHDWSIEDALSKEQTHMVYIEKSTGARLNYGSCLSVLAHFVGCLPHDNETVLATTFVMTMEHKKFICEVLLPENSPVRSVAGRPSTSKALAKRSAAFEACLCLRKAGYLDANMLPIYHKQLPAMRNAHLALKLKKTNAYNMRTKPSLWEKTRGSCPNTLFVTVLTFTAPESFGRPCQPLALLTRTPMPEIPSFPIYPQSGKKSEVACIILEKQLIPSAKTLSRLTSFTLRIYRDIFNKVYEVNEPQMSYWLAPIIKNHSKDISETQPDLLIDWPVVDFVHQNEEIPWNINTPHDQLGNRYLVDRWDGGRRFFSERVVPGVKPLDPVPEGSPAHKYMNNILDYTVSLFSKSRARATWRHDQPVLSAHRVLHRRNLLDDIGNTDKETNTLSYLCPEPLKFSAV